MVVIPTEFENLENLIGQGFQLLDCSMLMGNNHQIQPA